MDRSTEFGDDLYYAVLKRINERRTKLSAILQQLSDKEEVIDLNFMRVSVKEVIDFVYSIVQKVERQEQELSSDCIEEVEVITPADLKLQLLMRINKLDAPTTTKTRCTQRENIEAEWNLFKIHNVRGKYLTIAYNILLSVQPTSTESERCFSRSAFLCNKFRGSMKDSTLSGLTFLSFYFKKMQ